MLDEKRRLRVLAVSPRFAPTNGADTHRLRLLLGHASFSGWEVEVLAVDSTDVPGPVDAWLEERLPSDVPIHRVRAFRLRGFGLNNLAPQSFWPLYRKGCALLRTGRFDVVFFSTTEFPLHLLGPLWKHRYGTAFCMDYQDPWVDEYYRKRPALTPPGGRLKFAVADWLHRLAERAVVRHCSGYLAVSQSYLADIQDRYGAAVAGKPMLVRAFPAEPGEVAAVRAASPVAMESGSVAVWRYIGRGGHDMTRAASAFFQAWRQAVVEGRVTKQAVRFEAHGTSYAAPGQGEKTFEPLVSGTLLADQVHESPDRLGYREALGMLLKSSSLVVFGSDDPAYTASKIYPYLLAGRPLLAIFHEDSSVVRLIREVGGGVCVTFNERTTAETLAAAIGRAWFEHEHFRHPLTLDALAFEPYTAKAQARDMHEWFCAATLVRHLR